MKFLQNNLNNIIDDSTMLIKQDYLTKLENKNYFRSSKNIRKGMASNLGVGLSYIAIGAGTIYFGCMDRCFTTKFFVGFMVAGGLGFLVLDFYGNYKENKEKKPISNNIN